MDYKIRVCGKNSIPLVKRAQNKSSKVWIKGENKCK